MLAADVRRFINDKNIVLRPQGRVNWLDT